MATHDPSLSQEEIRKANQKKIIKVALILAVVTIIEFIFALNWPDGMDRTALNLLFVILTLVKAFYIIGEFMHLKHEVKLLIWSIALPVLFVIWLIVALLYEGGSVLN